MLNPAVLSALPELTAIQASDFWGEYQPYPRSDWREQVAAGDTQLGYWEWVEHRLEQEANASTPAPESGTPLEPAAEISRLRAMNTKLHQVCQQLLSRFAVAPEDQKDSLREAVESLLAEVDAMRCGSEQGAWFGGFSETFYEGDEVSVDWPNLLITATRVRELLSR